MVETLFGRLAHVLMRRRVLIGALFIGLCTALFSGALRLEADFSARAFFGGDDEATADLDAFQAIFGPDDNVILVVANCAKCEGDLLETARLERLERLTRAVQNQDGVDRVLSLTSLPLPREAAGALDFSPIGTSVPEGALARSAWRSRILRDRALVPVLLSKDAKASAMFVSFGEARVGTTAEHPRPRVDPDDVAAVRVLTERLRDVAKNYEGDDVVFSLTGTPVIRADLLSLILHDEVVFVPVSFALMGLLLFLLYRRFIGVALPLLAAALPAALVMGVMGFLGEPIGVVNQVYFTLLPVIAVSGSIHFLSRYYYEAHHVGAVGESLLPRDRAGVIVLAIERTGGPIVFSALTTVIGLLSLQLSGMPILRSFGLYSSIGVSFSLLGTLVLLPLVLSATRGRTLSGPAGEGGQIDVVLARCAEIGLGHPKTVTAVALGVFVGSLVLANQIVVDNTLTGMIGPGHPAYAAGRVVDEKLGGLVALEVHAAGEPGFLDDPAVLRALAHIEERAREEPGVRAVQGPAFLMARLAGALVGERASPGLSEAAATAALLPDERTAAAQLWFLAEGHPLLRDVTDDKRQHGRVQILTADVGGEAMVAMRQSLATDFRRILDEEGGEAGRAAELSLTGTALTSYLGVNKLADDMKKSVLWAFAIIVVVITLVLGSLRMGLAALLPNALPIALGAALLPLLGWHLEPGPAVVFTVAIGIAVDDTIHILFRFKEARSRGHHGAAALRESVVRSGRPVVITTVILAAGFGVHVASAFPTNARVGTLGAFVIVTALLADLFVLPAVMRLLLVDEKDAHEGAAAGVKDPPAPPMIPEQEPGAGA